MNKHRHAQVLTAPKALNYVFVHLSQAGAFITEPRTAIRQRHCGIQVHLMNHDPIIFFHIDDTNLNKNSVSRERNNETNDCKIKINKKRAAFPTVSNLAQKYKKERAHPELNQGPGDLQSPALTTELYTRAGERPILLQLHMSTELQNALNDDGTMEWRRNQMLNFQTEQADSKMY